MAPSRAFIVLLVVQILLMLPLISCHAEEITNTLVPAEQLGLTPVLVRNMSGCVEAEVTSDGAISLLPLCPGEAVLIVCNSYSESAEIVVSVNDDLRLTYTLRSFEAPKAYANVMDYGDRVVDYCEEIPEGETKPCNVIGSSRHFTASLKDDPIKQTYTRAYKKYVARRRLKTVTEGQFTTWSAEAKKLRQKAYDTGMHEETFRQMLDDLIRNITEHPQRRILATLSKRINEEKYSVVAYKAKGIGELSSKLPAHIKDKISCEI